MINKIWVSFIPFLSALLPVCSAPGSEGVSVFASMMNQNPDRMVVQQEGNMRPEKIRFDEAFRVMSFNIGLEERWAERRDRVASMIRFHHSDLIGLQESNETQVEDLKRALKEFGSYSAEDNSIFFRKSRFELVEGGSFQNPTSKFKKGTVWVKLKDKKMRREFIFFNTHFDYFSEECRNQSVDLLIEKVKEIARFTPFIITGDFNLFPELGGEETYEKLVQTFTDAQKAAQFPHHGPTGTWSGFKEAGQPGVKPDYIFIGPDLDVYLHGVLSDSFDGHFPSDHLPVVADLAFSPLSEK